MKKFVILTLMALVVFATPVFADTVITAPIDSRPISSDYLGNLVELGGDNLICADKENLDYFSADLNDSYFGNSVKVRENIYDLVSQNNKKSTTVILNSSSYITNGLVGSRCGKNYNDYLTATEDLEKLLQDNKNPTYYFNLSMPRSLPETRFNTIWREENCPDLLGIGYFYAKNNANAKDSAYVNKNYGKVNPSQFLLEYGYVENKAAEIGERNLTKWEYEFLKYFRSSFLNKEPYRTYIEDYKKPYIATADIFGRLLKLQQKGLLDEIIVSNDDLQLPQSISYFYGKKADWVQLEKGTPVKYSFPRTMLVSDYNSIYKQFDRASGSRERSYATVGMGKNVNFIFGTDEVPQLIYARSLSKKENTSADFNIKTNSANKTAGDYDVTSIRNLLDCSTNFVSVGNRKTAKIFNLYLYNYNNDTDATGFLLDMKAKYKKGQNIGLIEIYSSKTLNYSKNTVFKKIIEGGQAYPLVTELASYSAWNTNGNAIGLGVAHSQVYAITEEMHHNPSVIVNAQIKMLAQHIYEDGVYTVETKRLLSNEGYRPSNDEKLKSDKLYGMLKVDTIKQQFKNNTYKIGNTNYKIKSFEMVSYGFPWCRTFDCFLDFDVKTEKA